MQGLDLAIKSIYKLKRSKKTSKMCKINSSLKTFASPSSFEIKCISYAESGLRPASNGLKTYLLVLAMSTSEFRSSLSSPLSILPDLSSSHISKIILNLSSVRPLLNKTMVSRNSWKEIRPSPSLSTMLNILCTKTSPSFIPNDAKITVLEQGLLYHFADPLNLLISTFQM